MKKQVPPRIYCIPALEAPVWVDWSREGELLVATRSGHLQVQSFVGDRVDVTFQDDLTESHPSPFLGKTVAIGRLAPHSPGPVCWLTGPGLSSIDRWP